MLINISEGIFIESKSEVRYEVGLPEYCHCHPHPFPPGPPFPPIPKPIQGIQGIQGTQGLTGVQGYIGLHGHIGPQGIMGAQGIAGKDGVDGIQGATGIQGAMGLHGHTGPQGIIGPQGVQGVQGPAGGSSETNIDLDLELYSEKTDGTWVYSGKRFDLDTEECPINGYEIKHNLEMYPLVSIYTLNNGVTSLVEVEVQYPDPDKILLKWKGKITNGYCILK